MNRKALLLTAWIGMVYAVLGHGLAMYDQNRLAIDATDQSAVDQAPTISWMPMMPKTLIALALRAMQQEAAAGVALLKAAHRVNPTDSEPLFHLAKQSLQDGNIHQADLLADHAVGLQPAYARTHLRAAAYWANRNRFDKTLNHWSTAAILDTHRQNEIFPALLEILENPVARQELAPLAQTRPTWWDGFFRHVAQHGSNDAVRYLYALRRQDRATPLNEKERDAYVMRLLREGETTQAYLIWISGLSEREREHLGLLFNGSFDLPVGDQPFGWVIAKRDPFRVRTAATYGSRGSAALELRFRHFRTKFDHLRQRLVLDSGKYILRGRVRLESLNSPAGLRWSIGCIPSAPEEKYVRLGMSEPFRGDSGWKDFVMTFNVPQGCDQQMLRLVSAGKHSFEQALDGGIWFDQFSLIRESAASDHHGISEDMSSSVSDEQEEQEETQ